MRRDGCWDACTGSPAGMMTTGDILRREIERGRNPPENLRLLWTIDHDGYPVEGIRQEIEQANRAAPDDDRVWLALADLATRTGRFERCSRIPRAVRVGSARRPGRLAGPARVGPGCRPGPTRSCGAAAAFAGFGGAQVARARASSLDGGAVRRPQVEPSALESLVSLKPADTAAIDRLASLAAQGQSTIALASCETVRAMIDAATERYRALISQPELPSHAIELARNAEQIGRRFDARAWWTLAARAKPFGRTRGHGRAARLGKTEAADRHHGRTLADLLDPSGSPENEKIARIRAPIIPTFIDEAQTRGLTFTFDNGRTAQCQLPETMSGGVALLDFDGDGWLDVYAVQGGKFPPRLVRRLSATDCSATAATADSST